MLKALLFSFTMFMLASAVVGQVLMHGQGDTVAISIHYGFLHVLTGFGIFDLARGHWEYVLPVISEIAPAAIVFLLFVRKHGSSAHTKT